MKEYLLEVYPEFYGELIAWTGRYIVCCSDPHSMVPTMLLQNCLLFIWEEFIVSSFAYYEQSFWQKVIFSFDFLLSALLSELNS